MQAHKFQEEMRMLVQNTLARNVAVETEAEACNAATQMQPNALVTTTKTLPDGAQVLLKAAAAADQPDETDAVTAEKKSAGDGNAGGKEAAPSSTDPNAGAPPAPEPAGGLDDRGAPTETPPLEELPAHRRITTATKSRLIPGLQQLLRSTSRAVLTMAPSHQKTRGDVPVSGPEDRPHRSPSPANPTDMPAPPAHSFYGRLPPSNADGTDAKCHGSARTHTAGDTVHSGAHGTDGVADRFTQQPASGLPSGTPNSHSDADRSRTLRHKNALLIAAA